MNDIVTAVASNQNQPQTTFEALCKLVQETIGAKLFTILEIDHDRSVGQRTFSNMPDAYPVSGEKPIEEGHWTNKVHGQHQTFVVNTIDEIAEVFGDFELIKSLGCEACINIPIIIKGKVVGTLNCLHEAGHYTPERVAASEQLKLAGAVAFLLSSSLAASVAATPKKGS